METCLATRNICSTVHWVPANRVLRCVCCWVPWNVHVTDVENFLNSITYVQCVPAIESCPQFTDFSNEKVCLLSQIVLIYSSMVDRAQRKCEPTRNCQFAGIGLKGLALVFHRCSHGLVMFHRMLSKSFSVTVIPSLVGLGKHNLVIPKNIIYIQSTVCDVPEGRRDWLVSIDSGGGARLQQDPGVTPAIYWIRVLYTCCDVSQTWFKCFKRGIRNECWIQY